MTDAVALKGIPYGNVAFRDIQHRNLAFVDKTRYIEILERYAGDYPFIVRPRRFGKTLFTQMLEAYYDEFLAEEFEKNFAGTYIGAHKTELASSFRTIHFDFSGIAASESTVEEFNNSVMSSIRDCLDKYPHPEQRDFLKKDYPSAASLLTAFFSLLGNEYLDASMLLSMNTINSQIISFRQMSKSLKILHPTKGITKPFSRH